MSLEQRQFKRHTIHLKRELSKELTMTLPLDRQQEHPTTHAQRHGHAQPSARAGPGVFSNFESIASARSAMKR